MVTVLLATETSKELVSCVRGPDLRADPLLLVCDGIKREARNRKIYDCYSLLG
jgi:hypothetical protein